MRTTISVLGIIIASVLTIYGLIFLGHKIFPKQEKPVLKSSYAICRQEKAQEILQQMNQCVKDSDGNNVRCEKTAYRAICGGY